MCSVVKISLSALFLIFFSLLTYDPLWVMWRRHRWYVTGERLQSQLTLQQGLVLGTFPSAVSPCGPVQLDTARGKWCIWNTTGVDGVSCILVKCDMLDIQQLLPQLLTCSARINPKGLFRGEGSKILFPEQQQHSLMHQWLVSTVAVASSRWPVGSGLKLDSKELSKLSAAP